ncbi:SagB family peptide dehydrogenase [soil metagenome]
MTNSDTQAALTFHSATKYLPFNEKLGKDQDLMGEPPNSGPGMGEQSPTNEPLPYKIYTALEPIELPRDFPSLTTPGLDAIAATGELDNGQAIPDLNDIARICQLSNGILKRGSHRTGRVIDYRSAGATGARYHLELYLVCGELPDLPAGVYHYGAHDHSLRELRSGDYRGALVDATGSEPSVAQAPVVMAVTSTFWRNAWRYLNRAYRHAYWDMGTTLTNVLSVAAGSELPSKVVFGFADAQVNALLDVDGEREATLSLVTLGRTSDAIPSAPPVTALNHPTQALSSSEIDFPDMIAMHQASSLQSGEEVARWRAEPLRRSLPEPVRKVVPLRPIDPANLPDIPVDVIIQRRRSVRHYDVERPVPFDAFSTLMDLSSSGFSADCLTTGGLLNDRYLIVNNVEGLEPGTYVHHPDRGALELLKAGNFRDDAARLASGQEYAAAAHVNFYSLVDLDLALERYGNRGYRLAQTEASLLASKLHIATHALGLGAVGSTSVDNDVIDFFSPHAAGKSYMFILTFGMRRRRTT